MKEDQDIKYIIGKRFIKLFSLRLTYIKDYQEIKKKHEWGLRQKEENNIPWEVPEEEKNLSENIEFRFQERTKNNDKILVNDNEKKFFKMLQVLTKNHEENLNILKGIKDQLDDHQMFVQM